MTSPALTLDHVSLRVPSFGEGLQRLDSVLGLRPTPTPGSDVHARLLLDRTYVEVGPRVGAEGREGVASLPMFFLGFDAWEPLRARLERIGCEHERSEYVGADAGAWDNVALRAPGGLPAPILVRRTRPEALAREWPPRLGAPHPSGARTMETLLVAVGSLEAALPWYRRLLAIEPGDGREGDLRADEALGARRVSLATARGALVLLEPSGPGRVRDRLDAEGPGALGFGLGVRRLTEARARWGSHGVPPTPVADGTRLLLPARALPGVVIEVSDT